MRKGRSLAPQTFLGVQDPRTRQQPTGLLSAACGRLSCNSRTGQNGSLAP